MDSAQAKLAHCWFDSDRVAGDSVTTAWKRDARLRQARWREAHGHPIGFEPYARADGTPVGSRLALEFARKSGANFLSSGALNAVRARLRTPERHQMLSELRLWADLLSSMPLCFNVFGDLQADGDLAAHVVQRWWPDAPRGPISVRFEHSPGRNDPGFLGNKSAFDVAFEVRTGPSQAALIGVETKYHEHAKPEKAPRAEALARYTEITERSGAFLPGWQARVLGTDLQQIWLDHLLALSMLLHRSGRWTWARFVLVYPAANPSFAGAAVRYAALLRDPRTYEARTLESLLADAPELAGRHLLQQRYL
jgi:hypothetical protein